RIGHRCYFLRTNASEDGIHDRNLGDEPHLGRSRERRRVISLDGDRAMGSIEKFCERELNSRKRARDAGVLAAVPDALAFCREHKIAPPDWLLEDAEELCLVGIRGGLPKGRGRTANHLARYRQAIIDYSRWDAVMEVRRKQVEI